MIVKFTEVYSESSNTSSFKLREVGVNPSFVVCTRMDDTMLGNLREGRLPEGLDKRQEFTQIILDRGHGYSITVVGGTETVNKQLSKKVLLKG
jgi:hypothetical protein